LPPAKSKSNERNHRTGEIRFLGEIENTATTTAKLVRKLVGKYERLTFCYEAGPTGYELYRQIKSLGHECIVVAPSLIPKKPGDRVKTNRRDAVNLAKLLRAGELTAVWVPDRHHEAMRDLTRARETAVDDLRSKRAGHALTRKAAGSIRCNSPFNISCGELSCFWCESNNQACLRLSGTMPPLSASLVMTCLCSQIFISAEPSRLPL
jgi:hypothetical protein